ncbi:hypothetical protein GOP47_0002199 [Adiantum capillus-veneris]|uniref:Pentatricopeptide repeat-containing protein n=1 Tax=Adiantum capillus-veneris TaxID=13818 RepID=A0A9D4V9Q2_ADICA|nr:hypothetical protein GOP47_0002199 [Adiantum capillus-veneris]
MKQSLRRFQDVERIYQEGRRLSEEKASVFVQECIKRSDISCGRLVHSVLLSNGVQSESLLQSYLLRLFYSADSMLEANLVFCVVHQPNIYAWHAVISGHFTHGLYNRAIELFFTMQDQQVSPGRCTFLCILKVCGHSEALMQGQLVHEQIVTQGLEVEIAVASSLIEMYAKCGSVDEAYQVFESSESKDLVCWSTMIAAFSQNDQSLTAIELYIKMEDEALKPDRAVYLCILRACSNLGAVRQGMLVHEEIIESTLESDSLLGSSLIDMYAKCACLEDAQRVFDLLKHPDVITWNALLGGYSQHGCWPHTLNLFEKMQASGTEPDNVFLASILRACRDTGSIKNACLMHKTLILSGLDLKLSIQDMLVGMYFKCGALEDGYKIFKTMAERSLSAWSSILGGCVQLGMAAHALDLHERMILENMHSDVSILVTVLKACSKLQNLWQGKSIHARVFFHDLEGALVIGNALIDFYMKCQCAEMAQKVFEGLPDKNLVTWNSMIAGYVNNNQELFARKLFQEMKVEGLAPDDFTYAAMMKSCGSAKALGLARLIHEQVVAFGFEADAFVGSVIVDTYAECGTLEDAHEVFEKLPCKNVVCWNTMISRHAQLGNGIQALELFETMQGAQIGADKLTYLCILQVCGMLLAGLWKHIMIIHDLIVRGDLESDLFLGTALVDSYAKSSNLEAARKVFDIMSNRTVVTWCSMIAGYVQHGLGSFALDLISKMISVGLRPDRSTFLVAMKACVDTGAVDQGRLIHDWIIRDELELDLDICSAIINFYGKCGSLQEALKVFSSLPHRDSICLNALISGYASHGSRESAEQTFAELQRECANPLNETYTNVLTAFSHAGLVEEAGECFRGMGINQQMLLQYTCMIDLFGRAGRMEEAVEVLQTMPDLPDVTVWLVFLAACKLYGNFQLGRNCFNELCRLDINVAAGYMLMSDIYADSHKTRGVVEAVA